MLTHLLAWILAIASLGLYLSGFFLPELYRKFDLVASGAGLFFALTLWIYGDRVNGGLLLGTTAGVVLILWFGWQTFQYRWQLTQPSDRTDTQKAKDLWQRVQPLLRSGTLTQLKERLQPLVERVLKAKTPAPPAAPPPSAPTATPPIDTSPDMKEDLWQEAQAEPASASAPTEESTAPESTAASAPSEVTPEASAPPPEEVATPTPTEDSLADFDVEITPPASGAEASSPETTATAADLLGEIPDNSDEDSGTNSAIENPDHSPAPVEDVGEIDDKWPPPGSEV